MPNKPQKWSLKVWCLACSVLKYVRNFEVYCGNKNPIPPPSNDGPLIVVAPPLHQSNLAHNVVMRLLKGLWEVGHFVTMDNFFSSVALFKDLLGCGVYACSTIRTNCIGIPSILRNTRAFKNLPQGTTMWRMHDSHTMASVMLKDKKPVLLLFIHGQPIQAPWKRLVIIVPRRSGVVREFIQTSPVLQEYTTFMRAVDVTNQLNTSYSCQVRSHKWWHRIFYFLLDMTVVNMYIIYLWTLENANWGRPHGIPIIHLQF